MNRIISGETPDNSIYQRILNWPENWNDQEIYATYRQEILDPELRKEKAKEHKVMHTVRWAATNPRWAFEKIDKLTEGFDGDDDTEEQIPADATEVPETAEAIANEGEDIIASHVISSNEDEDSSNSEEDGDEDAFDVDEDGIWESDDPDIDSQGLNQGREKMPGPFGGLYPV